MHNADRWKELVKGIVREQNVSLYYEPFAEHPLQKRETMYEPLLLARSILN